MTEDALVEGLRALVDRGEYRDQLDGKPGVELNGGGAFRHREGQLYRIYTRGTPEYDEARARGWLQGLPPLARATPAQLAAAEVAVGLPFPRLLRRLYTEVADGGFGPGYGLLALAVGGRADGEAPSVRAQLGAGLPNDEIGAGFPTREQSIETTGLGILANPVRRWAPIGDEPTTLLAVCHWGCGIYSLVDTATDDGRMWAFDPNPVSDPRDGVFALDHNLAGWLARWIDGALLQPCAVQDEETGRWRGATDAEQRAWMAES